MNSKVLIGTTINEVKAYCLAEFLQSIRTLTFYNKDIYFVDNSVNQKWHIENIIMQGYACDYCSPEGLTNQEYVCISQNMIRNRALDYDYLLMLECDIFPPCNIIEQMLAYKKDVVVCDYFIGGYENTRLLKMEIEKKSFGTVTNRTLTNAESFHEQGTRKTKASVFGFGCTLISKNILQQFPFHLNTERKDSHSDTPFFFDLHQSGIEVQEHSIIVKHKNSSWHKINDAWQ